MIINANTGKFTVTGFQANVTPAVVISCVTGKAVAAGVVTAIIVTAQTKRKGRWH